MNDEETNIDEAQKADVSQNVEESPTSENDGGLDLVEGPIDESLRPDTSGEEEVEAESTEEAETQAPSEDVTESKPGRKTAEARIKQLNAEKKAAQEKADSLADQLRKSTLSTQPQYIPPLPQNEEGEVTVDEVLRRADALTQLRLRQQENVNRVNIEAMEAIKKYPELDPDSDSFDSTLSEKVSKNILKMVKADPTTSVKEYVDDYMQPLKTAAEKQASDQKETITKQVSQQAVRPTQVQSQEKPFSELSIKEMEEKLGVVYR